MRIYHLQGFRADIVVDTSGLGRSAHRIVVGQFATSDEALAARPWLPKDATGLWQSLLRTEFFDRLYEASGQNVMLALFYWFRSVTLDADNTTLRVPPWPPLGSGGSMPCPSPTPSH